MILPYKTNTPVRLVSGYGPRVDPITGKAGVPHWGYDLVSDGDKTVCAVANGTVLYSRVVVDPSNKTSEWGNYICILSDGGLLYYYCHLAQRLVAAGDYINAGQGIGIEGSTGRSTGVHLHFEVRNQSGEKLNPSDIIGVPNVEGTYIINDEEETMDEEKKSAQTDSEPSEWAKDAVEWAQENGIIYGTGDGDLKLRSPCTREQMLVFLHRFAELIGKA